VYQDGSVLPDGTVTFLLDARVVIVAASPVRRLAAALVVLAAIVAPSCSEGTARPGSLAEFCALVRDPGPLDNQSFFIELTSVAPPAVREHVDKRAYFRHTTADIEAIEGYVRDHCGSDVVLPFGGP
jgi:hypothetical protein